MLAGDAEGLHLINFQHGRKQRRPEAHWIEDEAPLREAMAQIEAYFAGDLQTFRLPLAPMGTPFQQAVWGTLCEIPYGATTTYGTIAHTVGKPRAARAVGAANGGNPLPIVMPCHRVVGSTGKLVDYGGGLSNKQRLLDFERYNALRPAGHPARPFTLA
jgi:methylated-DNA-[protein]-cysteine S-methyltransferase